MRKPKQASGVRSDFLAFLRDLTIESRQLRQWEVSGAVALFFMEAEHCAEILS